MKEALLQSLLDSSLPGSTGFKATAWQEAVSKVAALANGQLVSVAQLRNKWDAIKKEFRLWDLFQGRSGWTYDNDGQALEPEAEIDEWFALNEPSHAGLNKWRNKGLELSSLCIALIRGTTATGEDASPPPGHGDMGYQAGDTNQLSQEESPAPELSSPAPSSLLSSPTPSRDPQSYIMKRKAQVEAQTQRKKSSSRKINKQLGEQLVEMNANVARVARQLEKDEQGEAIDLFELEFDGLSGSYSNAILDSFENPFQAKRFVRLQDFKSRCEWVRTRLRGVTESIEWEDIDQELDYCERTFAQRQNPSDHAAGSPSLLEEQGIMDSVEVEEEVTQIDE